MSTTRTRPNRNATRTPSSTLRRHQSSFGDPHSDPYTDPWLETWLKVNPDHDPETFDAMRRRRQVQAAGFRPPETPERQLVDVRTQLERLDAQRAQLVGRRDALLDELIRSGFSVRGAAAVAGLSDVAVLKRRRQG